MEFEDEANKYNTSEIDWARNRMIHEKEEEHTKTSHVMKKLILILVMGVDQNVKKKTHRWKTLIPKSIMEMNMRILKEMTMKEIHGRERMNISSVKERGITKVSKNTESSLMKEIVISS
ncbi:hypothetical protein EUTSA_v10015044mg [Eutrema salsugineum]|uniref:Uncharacterized protein n=1 Tax=Eutrema salsugineum TaxID=72664 RepID=V4LIQ3_EUTSA|nr:hypothetical protein EUTSA_v10015044mg [Eutrema salsugineum]